MDNLIRITNLVRQTGDPAFLLDGQTEPLAIVPLDTYERLLGTTSSVAEQSISAFTIDHDLPPPPANDDFYPAERGSLGSNGTKLDFNAEKSANLSQEQADISKTDDFNDIAHEEEEEKFYLEPVE